jgi:Mn-dependent DtxR family transcriptional regulator
MSQQNVYDLLKRKKKWMMSKQIAEILKISQGNATVALNKLFKRGEVLRKPLKPRKGLFEGSGYIPYLWMIK